LARRLCVPFQRLCSILPQSNFSQRGLQSFFSPLFPLIFSCSPLLTTSSNFVSSPATEAGVSTQFAKTISPSCSPLPNDSSRTSLLIDNRLPSTSEFCSSASDTEIEEDSATLGFAEDSEVEEEEEETEGDEEEDMEVPATGAVEHLSAHTSPSSSPTVFGLSNALVDNSPLWAAKNQISSNLGLISSTLGGVATLPRLSTAATMASAVPPPVHSSIPLTRPMGVRNVIFQSTAGTTAAGLTANKGMAVQVPMMYQLATPPRLLAPLLTMVPSPVSSVAAASLTGVPSPPSKLINTSAGVEALKFNSLATATNSEFEKSSFEKEAKKYTAEPTTGQSMPYSDVSDYSSACSSPAASVSTVGSPAPRTLASIPHSELTPEQVELKGFAEDFKTRRIKLGFTQGSVGQSLAERGYSNFAQSTISRFEQMQLSPSNAATIRLVLEQWLIEAECPDSASVASSGAANLPMMASRKRKKRAVFTPQTKSTLDAFFLQNPRPNRQAIEEISLQLELLPEEVRVWFCNKRQKSKPGTSSPPLRSLSLSNESASGNRSNSTTPSPSPSLDSSLSHALKRRSVSPLHRTPFTVEELSKSSSSSTNTTTPSPVRVMSQPFSSLNLVPSSDARAKLLPMVFGQHLPLLSSPFIFTNQIAKTKA